MTTDRWKRVAVGDQENDDNDEPWDGAAKGAGAVRSFENMLAKDKAHQSNRPGSCLCRLGRDQIVIDEWRSTRGPGVTYICTISSDEKAHRSNVFKVRGSCFPTCARELGDNLSSGPNR